MESPDMTKVLIETSSPFILRALADLLEQGGNSAGDPMLQEAPVTPPSPAPVEAAAAAPAPVSNTAPQPAADVDDDGMPYDPEIHASTKTKTQDGKWKSRPGKADEAKAAREAFLSAGGNVTPPTNLPDTPVAEAAAAPAPQETPAAGAPGATAGDVVQMPGVAPAAPAAMQMPGVAPAAPAPADVTFDMLAEKLMGMIRRKTLDQTTKYPALLDELSIPRSDPNAALQNDPALRVALYAKLCEIEPDMV